MAKQATAKAAKGGSKRSGDSKSGGRSGGRTAAARAGKQGEIESIVVGFGERLRAYRKQAGLSQLALADAAEIDLAAVSFLERAKRAPNLGTLVRVARAAGVPPAVLVDPAEAKRHGLPKLDTAPLARGLSPAGTARKRNQSQAAKNRKARADAAALERFGANLRRARLAAGLSQETLAEQSKLDRAAISIIERGGRAANLRTVLKLTQALNLSVAEILDGVA